MRGDPATAQREDKRGKYIIKKWDIFITDFDVSLTVHLSITLANVQLNTQIF
jgi:hypothetical protein